MDSMDREELEWYHNIQDPWDWVTVFENTVADYCGYKYGVAVDSNSNAIRLMLEYFQIKKGLSLSGRLRIELSHAS